MFYALTKPNIRYFDDVSGKDHYLFLSFMKTRISILRSFEVGKSTIYIGVYVHAYLCKITYSIVLFRLSDVDSPFRDGKGDYRHLNLVCSTEMYLGQVSV